MSYDSALAKINAVQSETNDGANTANRVGDAMKESLDFANTKSDKTDVSEYMTNGAELPMSNLYTYGGRPVESLTGYCEETEEGFIAICNYHYDVYFSIVLFVKNEETNKYIFRSHFTSNHASTTLEQFVANIFVGFPATPSNNGVMTKEDKAMFDDMVTEVFPLTVSLVASGSNYGNYEIGQSNVIPTIKISIIRKGANVASQASVVTIVEGTPSQTATWDASTGTVSEASAISPYNRTYQIAVTQGGQTKSVNASYQFLPYLYKGVVEANEKPTASSVKAFIEGTWRSTNKVLSNTTSLGETPLASGKYYLFAVKQSAQGSERTLIVKNAKSGGTIDIANTDKGSDLQITRVNGSGSDYYSWVIVPASSNTWYFQITNS